MAAIVLTWNPALWPWDSFEKDLDYVRSHGLLQDSWSVGRHTRTPRGAHAYLYAQGEQQGLVAHGIVTSEKPEPRRHFSDPGRSTNYVDLDFDSILPLADRVPRAVLEARVPAVNWAWLPESGRPVTAGAEAALLDLWREYDVSNDVPGPDEVPREFPEGGVRTTLVNRYERDARARQACIDHWGTACVACGMDFESTYGDIGRGYVHVHHLTPVSKLGPGYQVNPVRDLRPLCPNCHAMAHTSEPPLSPEELTKRLGRRRLGRSR